MPLSVHTFSTCIFCLNYISTTCDLTLMADMYYVNLYRLIAMFLVKSHKAFMSNIHSMNNRQDRAFWLKSLRQLYTERKHVIMQYRIPLKFRGT